MQKDNSKQVKPDTKKPGVKKERPVRKKINDALNKEKIDEQNSDGSAGAFGEFIDQVDRE